MSRTICTCTCGCEFRFLVFICFVSLLLLYTQFSTVVLCYGWFHYASWVCLLKMQWIHLCLMSGYRRCHSKIKICNFLSDWQSFFLDVFLTIPVATLLCSHSWRTLSLPFVAHFMLALAQTLEQYNIDCRLMSTIQVMFCCPNKVIIFLELYRLMDHLQGGL